MHVPVAKGEGSMWNNLDFAGMALCLAGGSMISRAMAQKERIPVFTGICLIIAGIMLLNAR